MYTLQKKLYNQTFKERPVTDEAIAALLTGVTTSFSPEEKDS